VNDQKKLWESAYTVMNHPRMGPYLHGAGMVERTTGVTHFWLVRGPCTQSVVQELQRQLAREYKGDAKTAKPEPAPKPEPKPAPRGRTSDRLIACLLLVGIFGLALGTLARA
jgi:hypothetical protein